MAFIFNLFKCNIINYKPKRYIYYSTYMKKIVVFLHN